MYLAGALGGTAGVLITYLSRWKAAALAVLLGALMLAAIAWLERAPYEGQKTANSETVTA
jgi:hypothetical protein